MCLCPLRLPACLPPSLSLQVNYFPSRFDRARHAEQYPIPSRPISGRRERGE